MNLKLARTGMVLLTSIFSVLLQTIFMLFLLIFNLLKLSAKSFLTRCIQKDPTFSNHNHQLFRIYYICIICSAILFFIYRN